MVFAGDCKQRARWRLQIIDRAICPLVFRIKKSQYVRKRGRLLWHSHKSGLEVPERVRTVTVEQQNRLLSLLAFFSQQLRNLSCPSFPEKKKKKTEKETVGEGERVSDSVSMTYMSPIALLSSGQWIACRQQHIAVSFVGTHGHIQTQTHVRDCTCMWEHMATH